MPIEVGACFHEALTCNWICPTDISEGSLKIKLDDLEVTIKGDWRKYDALVWTPAAYDKFVYPIEVATKGIDKANQNRAAARGNIKQFPDQPPEGA